MLSSSTQRREDSIVLELPVDGRGTVAADLLLPGNPAGIAVLAHGSGSNRRSPRNRHLARMLRELGFATLFVDLLTLEEQLGKAAFDGSDVPPINLAERIVTAAEWLRLQPNTRDLPLGYLGAGTGAVSVLVAAAVRPDMVKAVVTRSGRTELADEYLDRVLAPTLLLAGSHDLPVVHSNRAALDRIGSEHKHLEIVPGASHPFEEPGALSAAAIHAANWFARYLVGVDYAIPDISTAP